MSEGKVWNAHQEPVKVTVNEGSGSKNYYIKEMTDAGLEQWMGGYGKRFKTNNQGKVVKRDFKGFHSELISLCLHDEAGNPVAKSVIDGWGTSLKNYLFDECQKMNGLTRNAEEEEGND